VRLDRIEEALERMVDGAFGRVFGGALHPLEVYRALWRALESGRVVSAGRVYAPNRLTATLNPGDMAHLQGLQQRLEAELGQQLAEEAEAQGWSCGALVIVRLRVAEDVRVGSVKATATVDESPLPAALTVLAGGESGAVYEVRPGCLVGRAAECDVRLGDEAISRHHCRLDWTFEGYLVTDLGSRNGTFVNDVQVNTHVLADADTLRAGFTTVRFAYDPGRAWMGDEPGADPAAD
jgi:hypothetical protein